MDWECICLTNRDSCTLLTMHCVAEPCVYIPLPWRRGDMCEAKCARENIILNNGLHVMKIPNPMLSATKKHGLHLLHKRSDISLLVMTLRTEDIWIINKVQVWETQYFFHVWPVQRGLDPSWHASPVPMFESNSCMQSNYNVFVLADFYGHLFRNHSR